MLNLAHQRMCCCAPGLGFAPSNSMCSCYRVVCALDGLTNRSVWDQKDRGNDLQPGDCLEFTLPLCASGVALQSHKRFRGQEGMEVKGSTSSCRK